MGIDKSTSRSYAELVSAPHKQSVLHAGYLSYGVLKQVIKMTTCFNLSWVAIAKDLLYAMHNRPQSSRIDASFLPMTCFF